MKRVLNLAVVSSVLLSQSVGARVIYGDDGRKEIYEANELHQKLARSTPTMVPVENINPTKEDGSVDLLQMSFAEWMESQGEEAPDKIMSRIKKFKKPMSEEPGSEGPLELDLSFLDEKPEDKVVIRFCSNERFIEQPNPGMCSGFLIAPDLVATAGHCAELPSACEGYKWVFDFKVDDQTGTSGQSVKPENIYSCKKIITSSLNMDLMTDYAIIQLDRKVEGREPLTINFEGETAVGTEITVIGNPSGLPLKVTEGGKVRTSEHPMFFVANLDTYQGNSGSAVFNATTNKVEGILVRGEDDFTYNLEKNCLESNRCENDACRGEDVSRITSIPEIALKEVLDTAAVEGDLETLEKILALKVWVDFYVKDGQTALMKAAGSGSTDSVKALLAHGADVKLTDAQGNTALHHLARVLKKKNLAALDALVAAGADLKARNNRGQTPVKAALKARNLKGAYYLIRATRAQKRNTPVQE